MRQEADSQPTHLMRFPGADLEPARLAPDGACPRCGYDLRAQAPRGACPECGLPYTGPEIVLEANRPDATDLVRVGAGWGLVILLAVGLRQAWLAGPLVALMAAHLGHRAEDGRPARRRLAVLANGVAVVRGARVVRFSRWHLFDEARLRPHLVGGPAGGASQWKLTLVNAYKPSISTYLHNRGTDGAIFAECVEFVFDAPSEDARAIQRHVQDHIESARRRFRALRLREMGLAPIDPATILRLRACPACGAEVRHDQLDGPCPGCGRPLPEGAFALEGTLPRGHPGLVVLALMLAAAAPCLALDGAAIGAVVCGVGALLAGAAWCRSRGRAWTGGPPGLLVTRRGLEIWARPGHPPPVPPGPAGDAFRVRADTGPHEPLIVHPWSSRPAVRSALLEGPRWRLALWLDAKHTVRYSPMLQCWLCAPAGPPFVDLILDAPEREGRVLCEEVERRAGADASESPRFGS